MANKKTPRGIRNNNPLNIRKGNNWQGERLVQSDPAFEEFESMQMGIRAAFKILRNYMTGRDGHYKPCDTISKIISRWAPESENATKSYINTVSKVTGINPFQRIYFNDRQTMVSLVDAMIYVECGIHIDRSVIQSGYDLLS